MSQQKKVINLKLLKKIISHDYEGHIKNNYANEESALDAYIESINAKAKEHELEDYIFIEKLKEPIPVQEINSTIRYKYKITISNLNIICKNYMPEEVVGYKTPNNKSSPVNYKGNANSYSIGLFFEFKHNFFILNTSQGEGIWHVTLGHYSTWSFVENYFKDTNFIVEVHSPTVARLDLQNNIFKNNSVKINAIIKESYETKCVITLSDNEFNNLQIKGNGNFHFAGKNTIKKLRVVPINYYETLSVSPLPIVHWGAHQKLDEDGRHFLAHKKIFIVLKQKAITNSDTMQEMILQREIAKCDHGIVKSEKGWGTYQDKAIFLFSKCMSNYGTSWLRPLIWLAVLNLIIAVSAQYSIPGHELKTWAILSYIFSGTDFNAIYTNTVSNMLDIWRIFCHHQTWPIYWKLFNPTSSLTDMTWVPIKRHGWELSFLFISQKVVLAFTLYEMIKIFRRFGRR